MKKNIILMGPPAAGKGTLAKKLLQKYGFVHISTGDMFRDAAKEGTELGLTAKEYIDRGDLVPDDITIGVVNERLHKGDLGNGYLLDGFPRTIHQAEALAEMVKGSSSDIDVVINLECDEAELVRRVTGRRICRNCGAPYHIETMKPKVEGVCDLCGGELYQRADDTEEALKNRLKNYYTQTQPLLDYYDNLGLLKSFDSLKGSDELFEEICEFING
ncbi:MAG: adenylate kinase [Coprobacillus sp.]|nr:adenylate kinase [Coprobacillus sp.]